MSGDGLTKKIYGRIYPSTYREKVFYTWYNNNRMEPSALIKAIDSYEGRKPNRQNILEWINQESWHERADELDQKAIVVMDTDAIQKRVEMMKQHAEIGREMTQKGRDFLKVSGVSSGTEAIRAIVEGTRLERENTGYEAFFMKIATADEETLKKELAKFTEKGDVIDVRPDDIQEES